MPAPALNFPVRANLDEFNKGMSHISTGARRATQIAVENFDKIPVGAGRASRLVIGHLRDMDRESVRSLGRMATTFAAAGVVGAALVKVIGQVREQLGQMIDIADKARDRGVGGNFFQRFTAEANRMQVEVGDLEAALSNAFRATEERSPINLGEWETAGETITEVEKALRVYQATGTKLEGLVLFRDAQNQEQKIEAVLKAMVELEAAGRRLESLQLGELMFGQKFVDNIRTGKTSAEQMLKTMELTGQAAAGIFSDAIIQRAKEIDDKLQIAQNTLSREMRPTLETIGKQLLDIKSYWADIVDLIGRAFRAINQFDLAIKKDELARVNRVIETGQSMIPGVPSFTPRAELEARRDRLMSEIEALEGRVRPRVVVDGGSRGSGAAPTKRDTGGATTDRFDTAIASIEKRTAALAAETAAIDLGTAARERARIVAQLEAEAKAANTAAGKENAEVTDEQRVRIEAVADAWSRAAEASEQARGPLNSYLREARDLNKSLESVAVDGLRGLEDGLINVAKGTETASEAFKRMTASILEDIGRILIRTAIANAATSALGIGGGGGGGILGSVFGGGTGFVHTPGGFSGAFPRPMAAGGHVRGPGTGTSDSILARLSNGEFVVNARATAQHRGTLERINSFAEGGIVAKDPYVCVGSVGGFGEVLQ